MNASRKSPTRKRHFAGGLPRLFLPLAAFLLVTYTVYQLLTGERGIYTWWDLNNQIKQLQQTNTALEREKIYLETQTNRLYNNTLDEDYVDELARKNLPLGLPEEKIIFLPQNLDKKTASEEAEYVTE